MRTLLLVMTLLPVCINSLDAAIIIRSAGKPIDGEIVREYNDFIVVKDVHGRETKVFKQHIVRVITDTTIIRLKNGDTIEGVIRETTSKYIVVDNGYELLKIDRSEIDGDIQSYTVSESTDQSADDYANDSSGQHSASGERYYELPVELDKFSYKVKRLFHGWHLDWRAKLENHSDYPQEVYLVVRYWDKDNMLLDCSFRQGIRLEPSERRTFRRAVAVDRQTAHCIESVTVHIIPID